MNIDDLKNKLLKYNDYFNNKIKNVHDIMEEQKRINGLHPHNEIIWDFINSKYFDNNNYEILKKNFINSKKEIDIWRYIKLNYNMMDIINHERKLFEKGGIENLNIDDIYPYIKIFNDHLSIETINNEDRMYCRFGCNRLDWLINNLNNVEKNFNIVQILKECNDKENWDKIAELNWHWGDLIGLSWGLYESGNGDYAIELNLPLLNAINIFIEKKIDDKIINNFFEAEIFGDSPFYRIKTSVLWIIAMSYKQIGNNKEYVNILKQMINWGSYSRDNLYYRLDTRHMEAAIRIYITEKNDDNLNNILKIFNTAISKKACENSEAVMERCLVMYDFIKKIKNKEIEI